MDGLEKAGLVRAQDRIDVLSNVLVVIVPTSSTGRFSGPDDLPNVKLWPWPTRRRFQPGCMPAPGSSPWASGTDSRDRVVPTLNVRAALSAVESENADAGIVYRTDAAISKRVKVAFEVPKEQGPAIEIPRAHRGVETGRHRGSGAASPLRSRSGDLCAPRLHRPPGEVATADVRRDRRRPLLLEGGHPQHAGHTAVRCRRRLRPGPLPGTGQRRDGDRFVTSARLAADRGRAAPARAVGSPRAAGTLPGRPRHRGGVHLEGGAGGYRRHVVPTAGALVADRIRGSRPASGRHRAHAGLRADRRVLPRQPAPGLARRAGGDRPRLLACPGRVRGHDHDRRQHPRQNACLALAIFHDSQIGRDDRARSPSREVTVVLAFAALWLTEWITRRRARRVET